MQEEHIDLKNCLFMCSRRSRREGNFGSVSAKVGLYGMPVLVGKYYEVPGVVWPPKSLTELL